jgi:hypothetical protein
VKLNTDWLLSADTLCIYINRLLGKPQFLQIKALAFPILQKAMIVFNLGFMQGFTSEVLWRQDLKPPGKG